MSAMNEDNWRYYIFHVKENLKLKLRLGNAVNFNYPMALYKHFVSPLSQFSTCLLFICNISKIHLLSSHTTTYLDQGSSFLAHPFLPELQKTPINQSLFLQSFYPLIYVLLSKQSDLYKSQIWSSHFDKSPESLRKVQTP